VTVGLVAYRRERTTAPEAAPKVTRKLLLQAAGVGILNYYLASYLDFSALTYISAQARPADPPDLSILRRVVWSAVLLAQGDTDEWVCRW